MRMMRRRRAASELCNAHVVLIVENVSLARDHRLRKQATALTDAGCQVSVICQADPENQTATTATVYAYPAPRDAESKLGFVWEYGYSWLATSALVIRILVTRGFDAVQIAGNPDIYFTIAAPLKALGKRIVFDQRDLAPETFVSRYGSESGLIYKALCWLERRSYAGADHVLVVNESLRDIAMTRGGTNASDVTVVGNGPWLAHTAGAGPRAELRQGRVHLAVWIGLMGPQDSLDVALRMIDHLVHRLGRTDCQFVFVGDGDARPASEQLATELGLDDWVTFTGWLPQPVAYEYLATASIGIESNLIDFVSPVKIMEYMGFGTPVVAFDLRETSRLTAGTALLARPGDVAHFAAQVDRLLDDEELRSSMAAAGRELVETTIAWDRQQEAYLTVFRDLVDDEPA
jgi:glycosyltransferase involved in cell wall biosynthesis